MTFDDILKTAKRQTDNGFAARISSLTRLTDDEIKAIAPKPADKENFARLFKEVTDTTKNNAEKAAAIRNIDGLVEIAIPLLAKLL